MQTDFQVWYEAVVDATDTAAETRNTDRGETTTPVGRSILPAPHSSVSAYSSARPPGARHQKSSVRARSGPAERQCYHTSRFAD